jgi:hypothetical protein
VVNRAGCVLFGSKFHFIIENYGLDLVKKLVSTSKLLRCLYNKKVTGTSAKRGILDALRKKSKQEFTRKSEFFLHRKKQKFKAKNKNPK